MKTNLVGGCVFGVSDWKDSNVLVTVIVVIAVDSKDTSIDAVYLIHRTFVLASILSLLHTFKSFHMLDAMQYWDNH